MTKNKNSETKGLNLLIIADRPGVKEEIIKQDMKRARLEDGKDKEGQEKEVFGIIEKEEFTEKNLSHNSILNSAITEERKEMMVIKVLLTDEVSRETIRKAKGINVTEIMLQDEKTAAEYQDCEFGLLEKDKVPSHLL